MTAQNTQSLSVESRKSEFVAVSGGRETTSAETLLVSAYALMWGVVFFFVWRTGVRQRSVEERLSSLEKELNQRDAASGG